MCAQELLRSGKGKGDGLADQRTHKSAGKCGADHRCLFRHLTLAAEEIARVTEPVRFAAAAARYRDLSYGPRHPEAGPVVVQEDGAVVPLSDLLAEAWRQDHGGRTVQGIDIELLETAQQLLRERDWQLPEP